MGKVRKERGIDVNPLNYLKKAVDSLVDIRDFVIDDIIKPVVNTITGVIEAALDDPIKTLAQIAAVATGNVWMLPLIEGVDVAIAGGDLGDVLKSTAKAYVVQQVGSYAGKAAGAYAASSLPAATSAATAKLVANAVAGATQGATVAIVTGQDPLKALISGGISAGTSAALGSIPGFAAFQKSNPTAAGAIAGYVGASLGGGNVAAATVYGAISASGIVKDIIEGSNVKLTPAQEAIVTDVLMGTATAALTGGNPTNVVRAALLKAGSKALGDMVKNFEFTSSAEKSEDSSKAYTNAVDKLSTNEESQKNIADSYNTVADEFNTKVVEQNRLKSIRDVAVQNYESNKNQANLDAANAATKTYNDFATNLIKENSETYQPQMDEYKNQLGELQDAHGTLIDEYTSAAEEFKGSVDNLSGSIKPIIDTSNRAFVEAMNPGFKADEYVKINNLPEGSDPYEHFLSVGQFDGASISYAAADSKLSTQRSVADQEAFKSTQAKAVLTVYDEYIKNGYSKSQITYLIDTGLSTVDVNNVLSSQKSNVDQLQDYASYVAGEKGTDSAEYKEAYKDALSAMADYGSYGVVKEEDGFATIESGKIDPDTLFPVYRPWGPPYDPVTGFRKVYISAYDTIDPVTGLLIPGGGGQERMSERDISALFALGKSANPPTTGGVSVFGDGSGASSGFSSGLQLVAKDSGSGDTLYDGGNGFAFLAYSDGTGRVVNKETYEVFLVNPEETKDILTESLKNPQTDSNSVKSNLNSNLEASIQIAIADAKAMGMQGDAALESAIATVAAEAGSTKTELLSQIGKTESQLREDFSVEINSVKSNVADTKAAIEAAIAEAKEAGLQGDFALKAAIDAIAAEQGVSSTSLLNNLSTTEAALKAEFAAGLESVSEDVQAKYDALTAEQKALAEQLRQQGVDFGSAIEQAQAQTQQQIEGLSADVQAQYDALTTEQKALATSLAQQGVDLNDAIAQAQAQTQEQIEGVSADVQAKYDALNQGQKDLADALTQQGIDFKSAIDLAQTQTQQQISDFGAEVNQRVDQLMQQGQTYQQATQQAIAEVNTQNQQLQETIGTKGRGANQSDIDLMLGMISDPSKTNLAYDVTGDQQITSDDVDFLRGVISGGQTWSPPASSAWSPTGMFLGQEEAENRANESIAQERAAAIARQKESDRKFQLGQVRGQAQAQVQRISDQLPAAYQAAQTEYTPIYGGAMQEFDFGSPLDVNFFGTRKEKQTNQNNQQPIKIAAGGYIDDLLAGDMTVDELLKLLR
jgi:hypothetical protein